MLYLKKITKIATFFSLLLLVGCFEIVEEITVNNDGSGNMVYTLNLSKSRTKLNSIMLLDSVNKYKVPSKNEIKRELEKVRSKIEKINGITNVKQTSNFDDYIFSFSYDFSDVNVLNEVIAHLGSYEESKKIKANKHFIFNRSNKEFKRSYHYDLGKEFKKVKHKDREIFKDASYTTIYRFAAPIESATNPLARISKSRKAIMLRVSSEDIINQKNTIKNTIQLQ